MTQDNLLDDDDYDLEDVAVFASAVCYMVYRSMGCPKGDTQFGFECWLTEFVLEPFERFSEQCEDSDPLAAMKRRLDQLYQEP